MSKVSMEFNNAKVMLTAYSDMNLKMKNKYLEEELSELKEKYSLLQEDFENALFHLGRRKPMDALEGKPRRP